MAPGWGIGIKETLRFPTYSGQFILNLIVSAILGGQIPLQNPPPFRVTNQPGLGRYFPRIFGPGSASEEFMDAMETKEGVIGSVGFGVEAISEPKASNMPKSDA